MKLCTHVWYSTTFAINVIIRGISICVWAQKIRWDKKCNQSIISCWSCYNIGDSLWCLISRNLWLYTENCFFPVWSQKTRQRKTTLPLKLISFLITTESNSMCLLIWISRVWLELILFSTRKNKYVFLLQLGLLFDLIIV